VTDGGPIETRGEPAVEAAPETRTDFILPLIGALLVAGAAASITLAFMQWLAPGGLGGVIGSNAIEKPYRGRVLLGALVTAALAFSVTVAVGIWRKDATGPLRWGKLASPLLLAVFIPSLFTRGPWSKREPEYLALLGVFGLVLEQFLLLALPELARLPWLRWPAVLKRPQVAVWLARLPLIVVCAAMLYYAVLISHYTLITHIRMETATPDLGEYDNQFFNSLHGHPFRLPSSEGNLQDWSALKFHADFVIYALLPFYALRPGPEALLVIQTVIIAGTALPLYLFAAKRVPRIVAMVVACAFLLMPAIERPNFYDFHAVPIGMFFVAWTIWAADRVTRFETRRRRDYVFVAIPFVLALSSREDVAFGMIVVSLVLLFSGRAQRMALAMLGTSAAYFVLIKFVIMPRIGLVWYHGVYDDLKAAGYQGYGAVVATLLTNPVFAIRSMLTAPKLLYALHMLSPLLFLWIRRPVLWVAAVPSVFFTLMVTNRAPMYESSFQYAYQWFPYIVIASVLQLERLRSLPLGPVRQLAATVALALAASGAGYQFGVLLGGKKILGGFSEKSLKVTKGELKRHADLKALAERIPEEASVAATSRIGPHVSTRLILYNLGYTLGKDTDYLLFDRDIGHPEAVRVLEALRSGKYGVLAQRDPFVLAQRGHGTADNQKVIRWLATR